MFEHKLIVVIADLIGVTGVILVLIAYFLLNTNRLFALNLSYQLLNFFGALMILFSLLFTWNTASVLVESAWVLISIVGIYRAARTQMILKKLNK